MIFTLISCSIHLQQTCFDMPRSQQSWKIFTDSSLLLTADISSPNIEHNVGSCCLVQYKKKQGFDYISSTLTTRSYPSLMQSIPNSVHLQWASMVDSFFFVLPSQARYKYICFLACTLSFSKILHALAMSLCFYKSLSLHAFNFPPFKLISIPLFLSKLTLH